MIGYGKISPPSVLSAGPPLEGASARALLERALRRAEREAPSAIAIFDLDSTLIDNRPRQAAIMRAFGAARGLPELERCEPDHWQGWDFRLAMKNAGLSDEAIRDHESAFKPFWFERFFTSEYCALDQPIAGAVEYTRAVADTGAQLVYVTGRPEDMRDGTLNVFTSRGFPQPGGDRARLIMKPTLMEGDDIYKIRIHDELRERGQVVAAFDNEPTHINGYQDGFPAALCVHLATDHSPRDVRVAEGIPSIRDFTAFARRGSD